jgi:F-type H+-transporting ATPase subunit gamma
MHLLIVATADRGLCGGFNTNIVKMARQRIQALQRDGKKFKILCLGKKGRDQLKRQFAPMIVDTIEFAGVKRIAYSNAQSISRRVLDMFENGEFDVATIFYSKFRSVIAQIPTEQRLIPSSIPAGAAKAETNGAVYEYEPDEEDVLADLLPRNVSVQIFRALLENAASEQGARMSAMDSATRNAGDVIDRLTLQYNRSRQAMITKELIEIISGAEAL